MQTRKTWRWLAYGVGIFVLAIVIVILLIDSIVKHQIETRGTRAVGAKVELARADVSFFPLGVTLTNLQVTNPNAPMTNAMQVERIKASVELGPLMQRKVIIEEMAMERTRFNTPRSTSGAVPGLTVSKGRQAGSDGQACQKLKLPALGDLNVDSILKNADLASLSGLETIQAQIDKRRAAWQSKLAALPGPETFDGYRQKIEKYTSGGKTSVTALLSAPAELQTLVKDLQSDLNLLKTAQADLSKDVSTLKMQLNDVRSQAAKDVEALVKKYKLDSGDLKSISQALLGEPFCGWVVEAFDWYERIKPLLRERSGAQDSGATQKASPPAAKRAGETLPDFLIRKAVVSVELKAGTITGGLRNVTTQQDILGQPTAFYLSGEKLKGVNLVQINGVLDHVLPTRSRDTFDMAMRGLVLKDFVVPGSLPLTIQRALADIQVKTSLAGGTIDAVLKTGLTNAAVALARSGSKDPIFDAIASVLGDIQQVDVTALVKGTLRDYSMKIESGLDKALGPAISQVVQKRAAALQKQFSSEIDKQITPGVTEAREAMAAFGPIEKELLSRIDLGQALTQKIKRPF